MTMLKEILVFLNPAALSGAGALAAVLLLAGLIISRLLRGLMRDVFSHDRFERLDQITLSFLSNLAVCFVWLCLVILYAYLVPSLHKFGTTLLAGVGLVSIIGGLASQSTLGHLVSGISMVFYRPFRCGDCLQVQAPTKDTFEVGIVETMTLSYTVLRTEDGRKIVIPNGTMAQLTFIKLPNVRQAA